MFDLAPPTRLKTVQALPRLAALVAFIVCPLVVLGWIYDIEVLKSLLPGRAVMKPGMATGLLAVGLALWAEQQPSATRRSLWLARGLTALIMVLTIAILGDYLVGWSSHLEGRLFPTKIEPTPHIVRQTPHGALSLFGLGLALLLRSRPLPSWRRLSRGLAYLAVGAGVLALSGHLFQVVQLSRHLAYRPMALHTAVITVLLALGILALDPDEGLMAYISRSGPGSQLFRRVVPPFIVLPMALGWLTTLGTVHGVFDAAMGHAILVLALIIAPLVLTGRFAAGLDRQEAERKAAQRTLADALLEAQAATKAKSEFLANMSHELRTPLNSVIGFAEMLDDEFAGTLNPQQRDFVQTIQRNGHHLLTLINDILDLIKIEAGKFSIAPERMDLLEAVRTAGSGLMPQAAKKLLTLQIPAGPEPVWVRADGLRLQQILANLLSNAVKFTPAGGTVGVTVSAIDGWAEVRVTDSGIGIAAADQERVFQMFEQVDTSYARAQEGTGLGLPLTRCLVELHGGTLTVQSQLGQGATFAFTLPHSASEANPRLI